MSPNHYWDSVLPLWGNRVIMQMLCQPPAEIDQVCKSTGYIDRRYHRHHHHHHSHCNHPHDIGCTYHGHALRCSLSEKWGLFGGLTEAIAGNFLFFFLFWDIICLLQRRDIEIIYMMRFHNFSFVWYHVNSNLFQSTYFPRTTPSLNKKESWSSRTTLLPPYSGRTLSPTFILTGSISRPFL